MIAGHVSCSSPNLTFLQRHWSACHLPENEKRQKLVRKKKEKPLTLRTTWHSQLNIVVLLLDRINSQNTSLGQAYSEIMLNGTKQSHVITGSKQGQNKVTIPHTTHQHSHYWARMSDLLLLCQSHLYHCSSLPPLREIPNCTITPAF